MISFRIRASKELSAVPLRFGYADGTETDGQDTVNVTTEWQYRLSLITVDFPAEYARVLAFDLSGHLDPGDWCEVADLNVCYWPDSLFIRKSHPGMPVIDRTSYPGRDLC